MSILNKCLTCFSSFFRRSVNSNAVYKCRRGTKNCQIKTEEKLICRYCRYEKCKQAGMVLKKVINPKSDSERRLPKEEPHSTTSSSNTPNTPPTFSGHIEPTFSVQNNTIIYDLKLTIAQIKEIFARPMYGSTHSNGIQLTCLQKTLQSLRFFDEQMSYTRNEKDITITQKFEFKKWLGHWEKYLIAAAQMLMHIPQFVELYPDERFSLFKHFWPIFFVLIRVQNSLLIFGFNNPDFALLSGETTAHRLEPMILIDDNISSEVSSKLADLFKPSFSFLIEFVLFPMKSLVLDQTEMAYIILQILFTRKSLCGMRDNLTEYHERILRMACNELHAYYSTNSQKDNYVFRLVEMTKLTAAVREHNTREKDLMLLARVFKVFDCTIFDSELSATYDE
uniref:Nuclear receptor domain-containing protein n=1 Tax=Rhabditophanes sp. KR3021 TaxID=114890 RepID=A0AC35TPS5_9BILA